MQLLTWNQHNYAANLYKILPDHHYILPKPKFNFYIQFNISPAGQRLTSQRNVKERLGFILKSADRPNIQYQNTTLNQYNKKRIVTTGINYGNISVTFQDTVDEVALKLMKDYNDFYHKDMNVPDNSWTPAATRNRNLTNTFGYNIRNGVADQNFFESIEIYEFYNSYYTMYKLQNPRIDTVAFGSNDMEVSAMNEVSMTFSMEGITYPAISQPITAQISSKLGLPFQRGTTGNFRYLQTRTVGRGLDIDLTRGLFNAIITGNVGSFIGRTIGDIGRNFINQTLAPTALNFVGNALNSVGLGILTPVASGIISQGASRLTSSLSSAIGRLF